MKNIAKIMVTTFVASLLTIASASAYSFGSPVAGQASLGNFYEKILQGKTVTVQLPEGHGAWSVSGNSNPVSAMVFIDGNSVTLWGVRAGNASVKVCADVDSCIIVSVTVYAPSETNGNVLGASTYPDGQLISKNGTIYLVYKNTKTGFASMEAFTGLGYKLANVVPASVSLQDSNQLVTTSEAAHPMGSWIEKSGTVYYVHELGLIPVPSYDVFVSNGGNMNSVVAANAYDFENSLLTLMTENDSRVK